MLANRWIIDHAPLQIYASALTFSPQNSVIRSQFADLIPHWITQKPATEENWTPLISTFGNDDSMRRVAVSPTEDLVASVSSDGTASLWDYITGTERFKFGERGPGTAKCVSFSADGKRIAIGFDNGALKVRDFAKGKVIELRDHEDSIWQVAFSPRDNSILASTGFSGTQLIWNVDERRIIHEYRRSYAGGFPGPVSFSGDGSLVYFARFSKDDLSVLMSVETGDCVEVPETWEDDRNLTTAFSIDGQTVATATGETVTIKDLSTGIQRFQGPSKGVTGMAFSPDGKVLALVINPSHVELHDVKTWALIGSFYISGWIDQIAFCRDGKTIATCNETGLQLWDTSSIAKERPVDTLPQVRTLVFLHEGNDMVLSCLTSGSRIWDTSGEEVKSWPLDSCSAWQVGASPDKRFVVMKWPRTQVWNSSMSKLLFETKTESPSDILFARDGTRMVLSGPGKLRVFDTKTFKESWGPALPDDVWSTNFAISPNGQLIGTWSRHGVGFGQFQLWDLATQKSQLLLAVEGIENLGNVMFSPDGQLVALMWSSGDLSRDTVRLIEVATGRARGNISYTNSGCFEPIFYIGSQLFISVRDGHFITGWDTKSLSEKFCFEGTDNGSSEPDWSLFITPTGQLVAVENVYDGNSLSIVHQWEISTGMEIGRYRIECWASGLQLSDDGQCLTGHWGRLPLPSSITSGENAYSGEFQKDNQGLLYMGEQWVFQGKTRLLWFPPQYQNRSSAARGETVAFESADGGVGVIKFDLAKTPLVTGRSDAE